MSGRPAGPAGFELRILREVAGEQPASPWGAAASTALEWLAANGYITSAIGGTITEKGRRALGEAVGHG